MGHAGHRPAAGHCLGQRVLLPTEQSRHGRLRHGHLGLGRTRPTEIYLARIELHPDHQGRGIGSQLIRNCLLRQARRHGQDLTLDVLAVNQRPGSLPATGPARGHSSQRERHQDQDVHQIASAWPDPQILTMTPQWHPHERSRQGVNDLQALCRAPRIIGSLFLCVAE
ncbi:GNAT family N-acetyltransferase [Streptomyces sp. NPDC050844]|uniref:GNAT family N-acetyltransferase n=1 Tax=Streptomyces sp. NPDC050844 TaxID=3155790 RepID=UPI00341193CB